MKEAVVITGAGSGIGEATAYKFASEGFDLLLIGRSSEKLEKVKTQSQARNINIKVETLSIVLKDFDPVKLKDKLTKLSPPTILVNNAGVYTQNKPDDANIDVWKEMFEVNVFGSVKITQSMWSIFKENKKGSIVNVASTLGVKPTPNTSAYSASKAAMINWTLSLAQEGGEFGIRANSICPGIVETPIHDFYSAPASAKDKIYSGITALQLLKKMGRPEYIAESIFFFGSEQSTWTTGAIHNIDGGINIK
jgi:short-subunit dehydrogenase